MLRELVQAKVIKCMAIKCQKGVGKRGLMFTECITMLGSKKINGAECESPK